jgi:outer membrane receptor protein involved in Fe transport
MTQNGVSAFARLARWFAVSAVLLLVSAGALAAQQTGKIEGRVRDQAGAPIANAQVTIVGTAFSALTNPQGYYFINNVPAGTVALRASFIGYKRTEVTGVRVLAAQTITQDIQIEASPVVIEELTVVAAENPLVPRDEVTTKQRIDGQTTQELPVDRINNVLLLQPGVVASAGGGTLSIRGGRDDEAATYVDGVPVQSGQRGGGFVGQGGQGVSGNANTVGTNQFEQISVTTGAASADQGNAQSGIINLSTITGGQKFAGRLAMESDEMFPNTTSLGFNRVEGNLSGPLGLKGLSFALGAALEGQRFGYTDTYTGNPGIGKGRENYPLFVDAGEDTDVGPLPVAFDEDGEPTEFATPRKFSVFTGSCSDFEGSANSGIADNYGEDCNGARTPLNSGSAYQLSGNINWSYGNGSRLRFTALASQNQGRNFSNGLQLNVLGAMNGTRVENQVFTVNWTQNLTRSTERALALDAAFSYQRDRGINSQVEGGGPGTGTLGFYISDIPLKYGLDFLDEPQTGVNGQTQSRLDCYVLAQSCYAPIDQNDPQVQQDTQFKTDIRQNPYGLLNSTFPYAGGPTARMDLAKEDRYIGRAALDWQVDRYNRLRIGGQYTQFEITSYSTNILNPIFSDFYTGKPKQWNAFIEDRLDLGDVVVQAGLRYDWYDSKASRPCFGLDADGNAVGCRIFDESGNAVDNSALVSGTEYFFPRVSTSNEFEGSGGDPRDLYVADKSHNYLSPRIQVAFPVTEKTNFRLSYAHQVQAPDFALIYGGINTDLSITNTNHVFGSDLDFGKTITFEFGIRHAFSDDFVLDIAAYNKDNLANAAGRLISTLDPKFGTTVDIRQMTNADFGNTRGIDVRIDKRFGQLFNGTLGYSFQSANSTGTDPFTYINFGSRVVNQLSGGNQPPPQATAPLALSRPHNLVGAFALTFPNGWNKGTTLGSIFQNFSTFLSFRVSSGTAYTECGVAEGNQAVTSGGVCARGGFVDGLNSARLPTFKNLDMRFVKGFGVGRSQLNVYLDARNILNFTNVLSEFVVTKDIVSPLEQEQNWQNDSTVFRNEAVENNAFGDNGEIDLTFSGATNRAQACGTWVTQAGDPAALNCAYLVRAEERWGNGDGVFSSAEQRRASDALYFANGRGENFFYGQGARFRLGVEFNF